MVYDEASLPIDIHIGKLVDWLISRRHVKKNWSESVLIIRKKINNAIQDMPEHPEVVKLLSGSYINYFHCLKLIEILCETEKESKNIFGWYTSQRMKDWQEIVRLYEVDNLYLGESGQYLVRNVNFEIPSLKKQLSKCQQMQEDCEKRIADAERTSALALERYASSCKKLGLNKDQIKDDLLGKLRSLPEKFSDIAVEMKSLLEPIQVYHEFMACFSASDASRLPLLKFIIEKGNVTLYEWKHGEPPADVISPEVVIQAEEPEASVGADEIDFGVAVEGELDSAGEIDWGAAEPEDFSADIDFGIETSDTCGETGIVVESSGMDGGVARGGEALSLLHNEKTRGQLVNEMLELEAFFAQRISELNEEENILMLNMMANASDIVQYQSAETYAKYTRAIERVMQELTCEQMQHLYMIQSSPKYVDRLVAHLRRHVRESDRALASIKTTKQKQLDAQHQQERLVKHLEDLSQRTVSLQKDVARKISEKYNNRLVNIMGGLRDSSI